MAPTQRVAVKVPPGMVAGQAIQFTAPGGGTFTATIPQGVQPGGTFLVEVAAAAAPPMAQAVPMQAPTPAGQSAAATDFVPMGLPVDEEPLPSSSYPAVPSRPAVPPRAQSLYNCLSTPASAPSPAAPRSATPPSASRPTAVKHAECPICFEPLHQAPVGVFLDRQGRRTSTLDTDPNLNPNPSPNPNPNLNPNPNQAVSPAMSDTWCQVNCGGSPPNCPSALCRCQASKGGAEKKGALGQWGRCPDCYLSVAEISVGSRPKRPGSEY